MMTVSNVLRPGKDNRRALVSKETTERVLKAAVELGYVPNRAARSMRTSQTGVIGYVTKSYDPVRKKVENAYVQPFLVGLNHIFAPQRRHVALVEIDELEMQKEGRIPLALRERFFDALVVHWGLSREASLLLEEFKIPIIYWDSGLYLPKNCLYRDEFEAGRLAADRLLTLGHRRIGYAVGSEISWRRYQEGTVPYAAYGSRYEGAAAALKEYQVSLVPIIGYESEFHRQQVRKSGITALITPGGGMLGYMAVMGFGWRIPQDFSVISTDVDVSRDELDCQVSGATYDRYEAGRAVGELLSQRLERGGEDVPTQILPVELVDLGTAGPAPTGKISSNKTGKGGAGTVRRPSRVLQ